MMDSGPARHPVQCEIEVNDKSLGRAHELVREVTVHMKRGVSTTATIVFDTYRDEQGRWAIQDGEVMDPWDRIVVTARFGPGVSPQEVMRGYARDLRAEYPRDMGSTRVVVEIQDDLLRLDREHRKGVLTREGEERSDGEVVEELAKNKVDRIEASRGMRAPCLVIDTTLAKFIRERAEANGYELYAREGTLYFGPARLEASAQPTILVYAGARTNCLEFDLRHDGHLPEHIRVTRQAHRTSPSNAGADEEAILQRDFAPDQPRLGTKPLSSDGRSLEAFRWSIDSPGSDQEAESRAQAKANEAEFKIRATGELDGSIYGHVLLTHLPVEVDGVGDKYGGKYYVDEVTHSFTAEAYRQRFVLVRNATN